MAALDALEHLRLAVAELDDLRDALTACAPDERAAILRLIRESQHYAVCACAAAGVHPSTRVDTEVVRPSGVVRDA